MTSPASIAPLPDPSADEVLPFGEFLSALRLRGVAIGIQEYQSVARLLRGWPGIERDALRDALAALLARDAKEVQTISAAFDEWFPRPAAEQVQPVRVRRRWWLGVVAAIAFFAAAAALGDAWYRRVAWPMNVPSPKPAIPGEKPAEPVEDAPIPTLPELPPAPRDDDTTLPLLLAAGLALLLGAIAAEVRTRRRRREWNEEYVAETVESSKGPARYTPVVTREQALIPPVWMEDVAAILGRGEDDSPGVHLDVDESLRQTLRHGLRPHLAFQPPPRNAFLLLLEDVHWQMRPWKPKIEAFLAGLQRQRVDHERWYFDGDPAVVWREGHPARVQLDDLFSTRGAASLLILSTGDALRGLGENEDARDVLKRWTFRSWLNPIANPSYWNEELSALPIRVWPFTRNGLHGMAWDLARMPQVADDDRSDIARDVTADDIERMKRLIALVPQPTVALADELRRRYAADIPEEVVLFLIADGAFHGERYQLPKEELAQLIATLRADAPSRELHIRRYLLEVLRDSEPEPGSVAHLRWQLDVAMQKLHVGESAETSHALTSLASGPLRHEVEGAIGAAPLERGTAAVLQRGVRKARAKLPDVIAPGARKPPRFALPGIVGLAVVAIVTFLAYSQFWYFFGKDRGDPVPHKFDAYALEVLPPQRAGDAARLRVVPRENAPPDFEVWRGDRRFRAAPFPASSRTFPVAQAEAGSFFQVRSLLPAGNLAVSDPVLVEAASLEQQVIAVIAEQLNVDPVTVTLDTDLRGDLSAGDAELNLIEKRIESDFETSLPALARQRVVRVRQLVERVRTPASRLVALTVNLIDENGAPIERDVTLESRIAAPLTFPSGRTIYVPPGEYTVRLESGPGTIRDSSIVVEDVEEVARTLTVDGAIPPGVLILDVQIRRTTGTQVWFVDATGKRTVWTSATSREVPPGKGLVGVTSDHYAPFQRDVVIRAGEITRVVVDPQLTYGVVFLESNVPIEKVSAIPGERESRRIRTGARSVWKIVAPGGKYEIDVRAGKVELKDTIVITNGTSAPHKLAAAAPPARERTSFKYFDGAYHNFQRKGDVFLDDWGKAVDTWTVIGRTTVSGASGIILVKKGGEVGRAGELQLFVPDEGSRTLYTKFRMSSNWKPIAEIGSPAARE